MDAEKLVDALYAFTDCEVSISSRIIVIKDNRPVELTVSEVLRENTDQLVRILKRELELREKNLSGRTALQHAGAHLHRGTHLQEDRAVQNDEAVSGASMTVSSRSEGNSSATLTDDRRGALLQVRIRRISLFDINKHREEMEKVKAELAETRKNLKNLTKYAIGHLEALLEKYGPLIPA